MSTGEEPKDPELFEILKPNNTFRLGHVQQLTMPQQELFINLVVKHGPDWNLIKQKLNPDLTETWYNNHAKKLYNQLFNKNQTHALFKALKDYDFDTQSHKKRYQLESGYFHLNNKEMEEILFLVKKHGVDYYKINKELVVKIDFNMFKAKISNVYKKLRDMNPDDPFLEIIKPPNFALKTDWNDKENKKLIHLVKRYA